MMKILNFRNVKKESLVNILIVDDEVELLDMLKEIGNPLKNINLIYCSNALEAVKTIEKTEIHGIFSDVNMTNMKILDDFLYKKASEIPVYRFSGESPRHLNIRLVKPFNRREYLEAILELAGLAKIIKDAA